MANSKNFLHKLNFKYKLTILNENTLEETWHIRLSRLSVFLFCFSIAVIYFFFIAILIIKTPLRSFMPGYTDANILRKQVLTQALKMDSLQEQATKNQIYLDMLQRVVTGQIETTDSTGPNNLEGLVKVELEKVNIAPSARENAYCSQYEISQKYQANAVSTAENKNALMHVPAYGVVTKAFDAETGRNGVSIMVDESSSIYAVMDGNVIFSGYSAHNRYCMQIQHSDNFVSTYKFTQPFLKRIGEKVKAGEILSTVRTEISQEMTYELWSAGHPVDPSDYISFTSSSDASKKKTKQKPESVQPMPQTDDKPVAPKPQPKKPQPQTEASTQSSSEMPATPAPAPVQEQPAPAPTPAPAVDPAPAAE